VLLFFKTVDLLEQRYVFLVDFASLLLVEVRVLFEVLSYVGKILLQVLPLVVLFGVLSAVTLQIFGLFLLLSFCFCLLLRFIESFGVTGLLFGGLVDLLDVGLGHILFVKMDCSSLQLFVNADLKQHLVNVVLELLFVSLLGYNPPS
jgi:hypothetical protein